MQETFGRRVRRGRETRAELTRNILRKSLSKQHLHQFTNERASPCLLCFKASFFRSGRAKTAVLTESTFSELGSVRIAGAGPVLQFLP